MAGQPVAAGHPAEDSLIVALDYGAAEPALALARQLAGTVRWLKVGLELYTAAGPDIVRQLRSLGFDVFLDLKLYDIPNTVAGAVRSAIASGAVMLTIHASGGPAMLSAAKEAADDQLQLLAVTVLTSMDAGELAAIGIHDSPPKQVARLAQMAQTIGLNGFVCSPQEATSLRQLLGSEAILVTPGIRPEGFAVGDQKRIATPASAIAAGASYLVVGRPITQAADPAAAAKDILGEIRAAKRPA